MRFLSFVPLSAAFAAVAFVGSVGQSQAEIIYSQTTPEEPEAAYTSVNEIDSSKVADNFEVPGSEGATLKSVRFIGGYTARDPESERFSLDDLPTDDFRIALFEDENGVPGAVLPGGDFMVGTAFRRSPTGGGIISAP